MAGQTINDRILAARHSIAGQGLAKAVCKATTEEMIAPKRKHLDYLVHCTNEPNISIPQMATLLIERSQHTNWVVVFKALITTHHLMCYGNERFTQYMASSNSTFQLSNFLDKSGVQGVLSGRTSYDMSPFIRRYARYLNEKAISYRTVAFDFCKVKRGLRDIMYEGLENAALFGEYTRRKDDGTMRTMGTDRLLKTLPTLQSQLDALLEFNCTANDLTNSVINVCFMLLFKDLIRLFACYNDAIINLLEKYFDMNKKQCREALDLYKKFLIRMDHVSEFLKVAENVGIDKGDIPDLTKAPSSLLDALEQHLASIEGKKTSSTASSSAQAASNAKNVKSGVNMLSTTSTAFGTAVTNSEVDGFGAPVIDEALRQRALAEEEAVLNQYKAKVQSPSGTSTTSSSNITNNPFLSSPNSEKTSTPQSAGVNSNSVDLFAPTMTSGAGTITNKASDDLLQLNNPFADAFDITQQTPIITAQQQNILLQTQQQQQSSNIWMTNGFTTSPPLIQPPQVTNHNSLNNNIPEFVPESAFSSVFGSNTTDQQSSSSSFFVQAAFETSSGVAKNPFIYDDFEQEETPIISNNQPDSFPSNKSVTPPPSPVEMPSKVEENCQTVFENGPINNFMVDQTEQITDNCTDTNVKTNSLSVDNNLSNAVETNNSNSESKIDVNITTLPPPPTAPPKFQKPPRPPPPNIPVNNDDATPKEPPVIQKEQSIPPSTQPLLNTIDDLLGDFQQNSPIDVPSGEHVSNQTTNFPPIFSSTANTNVTTNFSPNVVVSPMPPQQYLISPSPPTTLLQSSSMNSAILGTPQNMLGTYVTDFDSLGNNLQSGSTTTTSNSTKTTQSQSGILTGDLESSLASLAENLSINSRPIPPKGVQWNSPKNSGKSPNWTPQPMAATNGTGYKPMGQGMSTTPISTLPPSPYQPQINLGIRAMPTIGMVQPLTVNNVPMNMAVYPQLATVQPANIPAASPISPQIQAQQKSLLFH